MRHGFALNVDCDLDAFARFRACGLDATPFTSIARELGRDVTVEEARGPVLDALAARLLARALGRPRLMELRSGITIFAASLARSQEFYGTALAMTLEHDEDGFWARRDGLELRVEGGAKPRERGRGFFEQAGVLVRLEVDDFDGFVGEIVGRGVQLMGQVKDSDEGRFAGFCDPDGNLFELIELRSAELGGLGCGHALGRACARATALDARAAAHRRARATTSSTASCAARACTRSARRRAARTSASAGARGTATFQIMGDTCTRACRYCAVNSAKRGDPLDPLEPGRLAAAAAAHGPAATSSSPPSTATISTIAAPSTGRARSARCAGACPPPSVEVLTPDFLGREEEALVTVLGAHPHVFNHNIETVRRIQPRVRIKGDYDRALWLLRRAREVWDEHFPERGPLMVKSGIVAGMGESDDEIVETLRDLRAHGVDVVTIGQYLQPTERHLPLDRWVPLDSFRRFREAGRADGLRLRLLRAARALVLPRRGAAARRHGRAARRRAVIPAAPAALPPYHAQVAPLTAAQRTAMTPSVWRPGCPWRSPTCVA